MKMHIHPLDFQTPKILKNRTIDLFSSYAIACQLFCFSDFRTY